MQALSGGDMGSLVSFCFRFLECLVLGGGLVSQSYIGGHLCSIIISMF